MRTLSIYFYEVCSFGQQLILYLSRLILKVKCHFRRSQFDLERLSKLNIFINYESRLVKTNSHKIYLANSGIPARVMLGEKIVN